MPVLIMEFDKVIEERHSVRNYSEKKVQLKDIVKIMHAGRLAPAAGNTHILKFIVVDKKEMKEKIGGAAHEQHFLEKAPYIIVILSDTKQMERAYGERGKKYALQQAGASIENMLLKAVDLNLSSCWIGSFDDAEIKRILRIPDNVEVEALLPIGYSASKKVERPRVQLHSIVKRGQFRKIHPELRY